MVDALRAVVAALTEFNPPKHIIKKLIAYLLTKLAILNSWIGMYTICILTQLPFLLSAMCTICRPWKAIVATGTVEAAVVTLTELNPPPPLQIQDKEAYGHFLTIQAVNKL